MCGRLSQYSGIHDFVAALSMPNALVNSVGDAPLERYNVAPTTQVALLHLKEDDLRADLVRWRSRGLATALAKTDLVAECRRI
jgi:putative SOS response-associated peptidase YedK